jgi:hypothetical protein
VGEHWTRPPLVPREAPPAWRATWRFRLLALIVLALLVAGAVQAYRVLSGATAQDPGIGAAPAAGQAGVRSSPAN